MMTITVDDYHLHSPEARQRFDAWLRLHGVDPNKTYRVSWDGVTIHADQYEDDRTADTRVLEVPQFAPVPEGWVQWQG